MHTRLLFIPLTLILAGVAMAGASLVLRRRF